MAVLSACPKEQLREREDAFHIQRVERLWNGDHLLRGREPGTDDLQLMSNDYLCIQNEPALRQAQAQALLNSKADLLMSSIFTMDGSPMQQLEAAFADYMEGEEAIVCQSGFAANVGLLQSIASPSVPIYLDMNAHASLWEGVKAAGARGIAFRHNNPDHAERLIGRYGPGILVVDTVYSTDGSLCPLAAIVDLAARAGCILVVDESHSLGTHGPGGAGLAVALGLADRVHFRTASLAKTFAGRAGLIVCSRRFKEYFRMESNPAIFSSGLLEHEYVWFLEALALIRKADERRKRLREISEMVRWRLDEIGYDVGGGTEQIIAIESGTEPETQHMRDALQGEGVFGAVFCAPATPRNHCLVRLSVHSGLTDDDLEKLTTRCAAALRALRNEMS
ncbi:alpha-hydroxyketone-type quorum-sensing autoinducer synthase [uncultured Nitratireductor sp.]|uniref:alpha-hydroxyketone-type quorum-sensing autoinducer synthase n=1 Tax=uncultured Nitratireductor sp. TaxID=520953 RepID=UPI0025D1CE3B|nr:alpha-hydroxyketone-type quorum-sensing autoinducer synthase [uncultured Nitratireductor sp.]